jgi:hypothetical protein
METMLNVEPSEMVDLRSRILKLPVPELVNRMSRNDLEHLQNRLEALVFDLDKASNSRSKERALRDVSKKGIPTYRKPLLATKFAFKCPSCQRIYANGQWESEDVLDGYFLDKYCPACKKPSVKKSHSSWYSSYKNN